MNLAHWIVLGLVTGVASASAAERDWAELATQDVEAAYATALADHPGSADERNPDFLIVAENARSEALDKARRARNMVQYRQAVRTFFGAFEDYHFTVIFSDDEGLPAQQWAGIIGVLDGERMRVVATHETQADLVGQEIVRCDGMDPASLYRERVKPYEARPDIEATRRGTASKVFVWRPGQFESRLESCTFEGPSGLEARRLRWDFDPEDYSRLQRKALRGYRPEPGVREYQPGRWWINASIFDPSNAEEQGAIESMLEHLREEAEAIRAAEAVVVDIRGNNGGSSTYGDLIVDAIWGEAYRDARRPESRSYVEWRVSPGNLAHMDYLAEVIAERDFPREVVNMFLGVQEGMIEAAELGETMYRQEESGGDTGDSPTEPVENPVQGQVYFLTNISCGSACLDFADVMLSLENVTQIGQPTTADTQYMEVRIKESPTGVADFVVPVKVYRDRLRDPKQAYHPDIVYEGFDWSDAAVEKWADEVIDARSSQDRPTR